MIKKIALIILLLTGCKTVPVTLDNTPLTGYTAARLTVLGMSCPLCSNNITGRLEKVSGIDEVDIDLKTGIVTLQLSEDRAPGRADIETAIKESGFTLSHMELLP